MNFIARPWQSSTKKWDVADTSYWDAWYEDFAREWTANLEKLQARSDGRVAIETLTRLLKPAMKPSASAVERLEHAADADLRWLSEALRDDSRKWFVANTASVAHFPDALFQPMLLAGIEEVSPDFNRQFVEPCMRVFGPRRVNEYLLAVIESGDDFQKAGAVNALVWAEVMVSYRFPTPRPSPLQFTREYAEPESLAAFEALTDVREREKLLLIETFVSNSDLNVRRSILGHLTLDEHVYPDGHKSLVPQVIQIAQAIPDEYIQQRLRYQLGESNVIPALLAREKR